jgi:hypothetical protein
MARRAIPIYRSKKLIIIVIAPSSLLRAFVAKAKAYVRRAVVGRIPRSFLEASAQIVWCADFMFDPKRRANGLIRAEIGKDILSLPDAQTVRARIGGELEKLIDQRIYFGRAMRKQETWADLDAIAQHLAARIGTLKREDAARPVFIAPFHFVSQYANIYVVEKVAHLLGLTSMSVVSGVPQNQYGDDHALIPGIRVLYTYGDANRNGLGVRVARALKRDGVAVLFADVPPFTMHRYPMETVGVTMFGKPARIHHGVFRMGGTFKALLLPFYLRFNQGRFEAHIFDSISLASPDAPQHLANQIESALVDNYQQWLPAGHPAMYAFAPSR